MAEDTPFRPMTAEEIRASAGQVVELPPFEDGTPLRVRMRRPNLYSLLAAGKIPNNLLAIAYQAADKGFDPSQFKPADLPDLSKLLGILLDAAFIEPRWADIAEWLTTQQIEVALAYINAGMKALEIFRRRYAAALKVGKGGEGVRESAERLPAGADDVGEVST